MNHNKFQIHSTEDGNMYCTGSNASGQLGMGSDITEILTPKLLPRGGLNDETIKKIACGESHVAIVTGKKERTFIH